MSQQAERRVGTVIGAKWRVDALLGSGSMAAVYAVTHRNGARAALKILHPTLCTDPAVCERFLGEGYLTNSVRHQGIVRVLDDGVTDDGCVFLVMDLLEGETLESLRQLRGGRIDVVDVLDIADRLMDVLHAVHTAGIIHRDLKPQNVFVCNDATIKLLDFGVARVFDRAAQSKLSMFGLVLGTPSFMSPEQALGSRDKVDHRSDIWSLGATIFTALTGETVHLGANVQAKLLAAATVKARSIAMVMPQLPAPIAAHIDMALRFKKEDRWQSVDAFRRAMRDARAQVGLGKPQSVIPPPAFDDISPEVQPQRDKGDAAFPVANVLARSDKSGPPPQPHGPHGTFIGIGSAEGAAPVLPVRPRAPSIPPPVPRAQPQSRPPMHARPPLASVPPSSASPGPSALAVVRTPSRPLDLGSIPAYGADDTGANISAMGVRKKSTVAVWLAAFALAAAAVSGVAFFAVKKGPFAEPVTPDSAAAGGGATAPLDGPDLSSATTDAPPVGSIVITAPAVDASASMRQNAATSPPRVVSDKRGHAVRNPNQSRPSHRGGEDTATTPTPDPPPTVTADPRPAPTLAPDPFGTPE